MEETGVAVAIANLLVAAGEAMGGQLATLVAIYLGTALLSNIIANNAAAAIMFPISFEVNFKLCGSPAEPPSSDPLCSLHLSFHSCRVPSRWRSALALITTS